MQIISNKFQLKELYDDFKQRTGKVITACEGSELNALCAQCWITLVIELSFELGEHITLSKGMMLLAEPNY